MRANFVSSVVLLLLLCATTISPKSIEYNNCKSIFQIKEVAVDPCNDPGFTCPLVRGENATISITFVPTKDVSSLTAVVHGITKEALIGKVPFHLPNPDACKDSNLVCPLKKGEQYVYRQTLPVKPVYPKLVLLIKWELVEHSGDETKKEDSPVCVILRAKITDRSG
ncbi:putative epididymal secretory protein E1 [Trichuris suis]|nr:putative epididymal secretory protein E1 [Trichuris suis]